MAVRFENVGHVFLKLVDAGVEVLPSENGSVHVDAEPENAFTLKRDGDILKVLTSTSWKLRNLPKKEKERARLTIRFPKNAIGEGA
ncbi:hypothetical protein [Thermococcus sp.]